MSEVKPSKKEHFNYVRHSTIYITVWHGTVCFKIGAHKYYFKKKQKNV